MATLNINGNSNDPYYRYQMPRLVATKTGRGNGCHTIIENINDVTESFNHPGSVVFKFMGYSLGANTNENKWSINGHYSEEQLIEVLYQYINAFVLCPKCTIPELLPSVEGKKKNKKLIMTCSACGKSSEISSTAKDVSKGIDLIIKYLEKNEWKIKKGTMVLQNDLDEQINKFAEDSGGVFNPFG